MEVLVTGAAGFVGQALCRVLLARGDKVIGLDSLNDYYDVNLKKARLAQLESETHFTFYQANIADKAAVNHIFAQHDFERVVNLAAQAGVRYSLTNPDAYIESNIVGFMNVLEACRHAQTPHLVYASTSSVYGLNETLPFAASQNVDHPMSLYAATKKSNELMAHSYSHLYGLPTTGLRFFTVYGPWGRPDMALFLFTDAILKDKPISLFNNGEMYRDFTYIDDIVEGVKRVTDSIPVPQQTWPAGHPTPDTSTAPFRVYNIGNNTPVYLKDFVAAIENATGKQAIIDALPMQAGDVKATHADVSPLMRDFDFIPQTSIESGVGAFVRWFKSYYAKSAV